MLSKLISKCGGRFTFCMTLMAYSLCSQAQGYLTYDGVSAYTISINGGMALSQTDIKPSHLAPSLGVGLHYTALRYLDFNLNVQKGTIKAGAVDFYKSLPDYKNNYYYVAFSLRFYPLAIINNEGKDNVLSFISKVYVGTGIGYLKSKTIANTQVIPEWGPMGRYNGSDLFVPVETGIAYPFTKFKSKSFLLLINYSINLCFSDEIDGYVPTVSANKWRDAFSVLSLGLGFKF